MLMCWACLCQGPCDIKWGPIFSTSRQASRRKDFVVLVPDEAFLTGLPEANIQPWHELQVRAQLADASLFQDGSLTQRTNRA
jgi:hypothetical protein